MSKTGSNLYQSKLKGNKIGVYFGTFAPLHVGHINIVNQAKRLNDGLILIASGFKEDKGDLINLPVGKRFRYLREQFAQDELIHVALLDEDKLPEVNQGEHPWTPWLQKIDEIIDSATENSLEELEITIYMGEKEYEIEFNKERPNYKTILMDRSHLPISATLIRENPLRHWNSIARVFRRHFTKKVLVTGSASGGKSHLVRDLARAFNSPFVEEEARTYQEKYNVLDSELELIDWLNITLGQYDSASQEINGTSNNGMVFMDTNSTTTNIYTDVWLSKEEQEYLENVYVETNNKEQWDIIFVVPPVTTYVDDNFRDTTLSGEKERWDFHDRLVQKYIDRGWEDKIVILDAPSTEEDKEGFLARYLQALEVIKNKLNINMMDIG